MNLMGLKVVSCFQFPISKVQRDVMYLGYHIIPSKVGRYVGMYNVGTYPSPSCTRFYFIGKCVQVQSLPT